MLDPRARPKHATRRLFIYPLPASCLDPSRPCCRGMPGDVVTRGIDARVALLDPGSEPAVTSKSGAGNGAGHGPGQGDRRSPASNLLRRPGAARVTPPRAVGDRRLRETAEVRAREELHHQADCTVGRLQPLDGKSYVLDGLWDNSDVGGGRTRWRGPDGVVVGRDNASGGLALSQQWEVLCPGRVSATVLAKARSLAPATASGGGRPRWRRRRSAGETPTAPR